jgi:hypothetical protein
VLWAGKVGGKSLGLTRARFCWLDGAFEGRAGKLGDARCLPPRRRGNPARLGRSQATRGGESFHGVPGRFRVAGRRRNGGEGAVHRAATMVAGGGARSSGGCTLRGDELGLVFKGGRSLLRDAPTRQKLTAEAAPYGGAGSAGRAGSVRRVHVPGRGTRRARIPTTPRSVCLPRKGATPREVRGRLERRGWRRWRAVARRGAASASPRLCRSTLL